LSRLFIN